VTRLHGRLTGLVLLTGLIPTVTAGYLLWRSELQLTARYVLVGTLVAIWMGLTLVVRTRTGYHLRTLSNLLAALREGDYSFRARRVARADPFSEVITELNLLANTLRHQRVDDLEATSLVRKVMAEIDVGERMFPEVQELLGSTATDLGLGACLSGPPSRTVELEIGGSVGRWEMRRGSFRQHGRPNRLLVLSDVSRALQAEELAAWKRLIRVIGHELNNSLAPITSLAGSLERIVDQDPLPDDWRSDLGSGLQVISSRVEALNRFMGDCSRLAKLPEPTIARIDLGTCVRNAVALEKRLKVSVVDGPDTAVSADQAQIEQVLINLVKNAVEASLETGGSVRVQWASDGAMAEVVIRDDGPGLPDSGNLFVPFFTTKAEGSGIGLFLSRQIAEAHGGSVTVRDREDRRGCEAVLRVPEAGN